MSDHEEGNSAHGFWRGAYRALLPMLPRGIRERQGDAMLALFGRELRRREPDGTRAVLRAGLTGLTDLVCRGAYERFAEERRGLTAANLSVLRHIALAFTVCGAVLTALLVARSVLTNDATLASGTVLDAVLLSIPHTAALTIPMSVFIAVLWAAPRKQSAARSNDAPDSVGVLRPAPVVLMASVVALCCLASNAELVPRANLRLQAMHAGAVAVAPSERSMTLRELRTAEARLASAPRVAPVAEAAGDSLASYAVEIHKKFALAAACVVLALLAAGIARCATRLGIAAQAATSVAVFGGYYVCIIVGEHLAVRSEIDPMLAMWSANIVLLGLAVFMLRASRAQSRTRQLLFASTIGALPFVVHHAGELRSFTRMQLLETTSETSASVSLGDVDHDGDLDVILAKGRHWPLRNLLLRNDGRAAFTTEAIGDSADRTYSAALDDLNGDGHLDLVVSNDRPDRKLVYLGDATGHFRAAGTFGQPEWSTRYITVADLNGDHRPDVIVANRSSNAANPRPSFVCLNDGAAGFPACSPLATQSATIIVAADFDGDGAVDLFVPHRDGGQSLLFWNDGRGGFAAAGTPIGAAPVSVRAAAAADIDGDGRTDIVVGDLGARRVDVYRNRGARSFAAPVQLGTVPLEAGAIALGDLNRDGMPEVVVGAAEGPGTVFFNRSRGDALKFDVVPWNDGQGTVYGVAIGDLDGDGWPDLVAARSDAPNAIWFNGAASQR